MTDFILNKGITDINQNDHRGNTPLHLASYKGELELVKLSINKRQIYNL